MRFLIWYFLASWTLVLFAASAASATKAPWLDVAGPVLVGIAFTASAAVIGAVIIRMRNLPHRHRVAKDYARRG